MARGITWVPDYVANAGGLIQVGGELQMRTASEVLDAVRRIGDTTREVLVESANSGVTTGEAASRIVQARLAEDRRAPRGPR